MSDLRNLTLGQAYESVRDVWAAVAARARRMLGAATAAKSRPASATSHNNTWRRRVTLAVAVTAGVACLYYLLPGVLVLFGIALLALTYLY